MLSAPPGQSSLVPLEEEDPFSQHTVASSALLRHQSVNLKKSVSEGAMLPLERAGMDSTDLPSPTADEIYNSGGGCRRESDGCISVMENSNDEDPWSPVVLGTVDWTEVASSTAHVFVPTSSNVQRCYLLQDCLHSGIKFKCVACRIVSHQGCMSTLNSVFPCKQTFRECVRKYREEAEVHHHWVTRKQLKGKCSFCHKNFQSKLGPKFGNSTVGINCSWCKTALHNSDTCKSLILRNPVCNLGIHSGVIIPPSWIVKLPRKGSFKSSLKHSPKKAGGERGGGSVGDDGGEDNCRCKGEENSKGAKESISGRDSHTFLLKPIPVSNSCPVIVFLNPKSGGNQGEKLMHKFQWLLNPRQVFDLSQTGPQPAIQLYKRVPGVRFLACGGDGTVGWVLSVLDDIDVPSPPPVGVLPLGTGNDMSRTLGWGGGYTDEPISKILISLQHADIINIDRWRLDMSRNPGYPASHKGVDKLPLQVMNNYFSLGVDALIALQFHEAREANPQKFNSRIRNKIFYGQTGSKDLILRKWKSLTDYIRIECDGRDITPKLRELKVLAVIFLNIQTYSSGTRPWNRQFGEQRLDDGLLEVIGVTTYQFPLLLAGGHGHCITQCRTARIVTLKQIPMQVDGEAARVNPSIIQISFLNQAKMLVKRKSGSKGISEGLPPSLLRIHVSKITMQDYEMYYCQKDLLKNLAKPFGELNIESTLDLEQVRCHIRKLQENNVIGRESAPTDTRLLLPEWCFLDSVTAERFFRVDRAQENLHFVMDICDSMLYILETDDNIEDPDIQNNLTGLIPDDLVTPPRSPLTPNPPVTPNPEEDQMDSSPRLVENEDDIPMNQSLDSTLQPSSNISQSQPSSGQSINKSGSSLEVPIPPHVDGNLKTTEGILKAARLGDIRMLRELCVQGYSLLSRDETGKSALHYGARFGHKEIIKFLITNGPTALLDITDFEKGHTALHKAAAYKRRTICCMLVNAGANLSIKDLTGKTAQQLALHAEDQDLSTYLESQEISQENSKETRDIETSV